MINSNKLAENAYASFISRIIVYIDITRIKLIWRIKRERVELLKSCSRIEIIRLEISESEFIDMQNIFAPARIFRTKIFFRS